jgi:transcriptional regulator with XRE-family HTH domain
MKKIFSERLRQLRLESGLTLSQLAERIGVIKQSVGHYETGHSLPSLPVLVRLADVFGCSLDHLVGRDSPPPSVRSGPPGWAKKLLNDLQKLDAPGREAVKAVVKGFSKKKGDGR